MTGLDGFLKKHNIKRSAFALRIGVTPSRLSRILKHGERPSLETAAKIERLTGGVVKAADWIELADDLGAPEAA